MPQHNALWRTGFSMPTVSLPSVSLPWWTFTDLWPTDGLMTSLMRPLDVMRPQLLDLSRTLDNILGATSWIGQLNEDLWGELRRAGQTVTFWAIHGARAALERGDMTALEQFVRNWLDAAPTPARMEALVEALLEVDPMSYAPHEGAQLLADLRSRVRALNTERRRDHETLLGLRRGAAPITGFNPETAVSSRPGLPTGPSLEDRVLDRFQPDVDPRLIEQIKDLPPADQKIVVLKTVTGCAWDAAALACGYPAHYGEVLRRRTHRGRDRLPACTDPWSQINPALSVQERRAVGRIRPSSIVADLTGGIWP